MLRRLTLILTLVSLGALATAPAVAASQHQSSDLLQDIPVTGSLEDGGTFEGLLDITGIQLVDGMPVVSGVLTGTATQDGGVVTEIVQTFTDVPVDLTRSGPGNSCQILDLDLGPIHLDVLGLVVNLDEVNLDITAERGPGNLLGNLLCAVAGLLDSGGALGGVQNLLNRITGLLGGLLG